MNIFFLNRYCYLRQEVDGTYILELHKDEKQCEAKATIVMDFCTDVVQVRHKMKKKKHLKSSFFLFRIQNVVDFALSCE